MTASEKRKRKNANGRVETRVPYISVHLRKERDWCFKERSPNILFRMTLCQSTKYRSAFLRMWDTNRLPLWYTSQRRSKYVAFVGPFCLSMPVALTVQLRLSRGIAVSHNSTLQCDVTVSYDVTPPWRWRHHDVVEVTSQHRCESEKSSPCKCYAVKMVAFGHFSGNTALQRFFRQSTKVAEVSRRYLHQ